MTCDHILHYPPTCSSPYPIVLRDELASGKPITVLGVRPPLNCGSVASSSLSSFRYHAH